MAMIALPPSLDPTLGVTYGFRGHREELLKAAARWLAFNLPDSTLQRNRAATKALEIMLRDRIGPYHSI